MHNVNSGVIFFSFQETMYGHVYSYMKSWRYLEKKHLIFLFYKILIRCDLERTGRMELSFHRVRSDLIQRSNDLPFKNSHVNLTLWSWSVFGVFFLGLHFDIRCCQNLIIDCQSCSFKFSILWKNTSYRKNSSQFHFQYIRQYLSISCFVFKGI